MTSHFGTPYFQTGRQRAERRAEPVLLTPPPEEMQLLNWHGIDTGDVIAVLQWRPGVNVWMSPAGVRFPAEKCAEWGWKYVAAASPP